MGKATFTMVAAGDGSPQSSSGYSFLVLAHAIATVLLLITLVAAVWQFMDWVVAPSCSESSSQPSVSMSTAAGAPSVRLAARAEVAPDPADCPCPKSGK